METLQSTHHAKRGRGADTPLCQVLPQTKREEPPFVPDGKRECVRDHFDEFVEEVEETRRTAPLDPKVAGGVRGVPPGPGARRCSRTSTTS